MAGLSKRSDAAVAANPEKSDRAIAADIGVHKNTVARARKVTGPQGPVEKRVGKDGKARKLPQQQQDEYDTPAQERDEVRGTSKPTYYGVLSNNTPSASPTRTGRLSWRPSLLQSDLPRTRGGVLRFGLDHRSVARWPIMDALAANARLVARTRDHAGSCRSCRGLANRFIGLDCSGGVHGPNASAITGHCRSGQLWDGSTWIDARLGKGQRAGEHKRCCDGNSSYFH